MIVGRYLARVILFIALVVLFILVLTTLKYDSDLRTHSALILDKAWNVMNPGNGDEAAEAEHVAIVKEFFDKRRNMTLTPLGKYLFLNEPHPPQRNKVYKIMVYKEGEEMEDRQLYYFGATRHEAFEFCSVKNCIMSYDEKDFDNADAVMFHLHRLNNNYKVPLNATRHPHQRWIFSSDESPHFTFMMQDNIWYNYSGVFNWSMIYRYESDVPIAFGRVLPLKRPLNVPKGLSFEKKVELLVPYANKKRRDVLVAIMSSNCYQNNRIQYIKKLQKYIDVDVYGGCAPEHLKNKCLWKGYGMSCEVLHRYVFYLSFLNSNCNGYITEKLYTHALTNGAIPIFMGMYKNQSDLYIPPGSYIHLDDYKTPEELAKYILHINDTMGDNYLKYHEWRKHFKTVSEDGYMGAPAYHFCRICEALNYNSEEPRVYQKEDLAFFLNPAINCHEPFW